MDVYVDDDLCIGCGLCTDFAPDVFKMNAQGLSMVVGTVTDANRGAVLESIEGCPTDAIKVRD